MATVKAIHQTCTGKNDLFINTGNHHKTTLNQFVKKIESGNSVYSDRYYIKHDSSGKTPVSKPNGKQSSETTVTFDIPPIF